MSRRSAPLQTPGCPVSLLGQRRGQRSWPSRPGREGSAGRRLPGRFLPLASTGDSNRYHRRTIEPELPAQCFLTCPCDLHTPCHLLFDVTITREGPRADSTTGVRFPELKIKKLHPSDPLPLTVLQSWLLYLPAERAAGRDPPGPESSLHFLWCLKFRQFLNKYDPATLCPGDCCRVYWCKQPGPACCFGSSSRSAWKEI
ncbi:uncharacterized protein LOC133057768 isoform X2 [Dama dama]|uniref:uncharacterized protein LOC133057768 isoform X2 n=1 Tax=Dama dama TaxID=30532 RepID=UPI002A365FCF|nr:uncharacterized protein LOC133057768 isoform X2 [Dama dama]